MKDRKQFLKRIASMVLAVLLVFPTVFNASSTKVKAAVKKRVIRWFWVTRHQLP